MVFFIGVERWAPPFDPAFPQRTCPDDVTLGAGRVNILSLRLAATRGRPTMNDQGYLRDKLRKIEALFAGAATPGERQAAGAAAERIRRQLAAAASSEPEIETRFSIPNPWSRRLFIALCRRYGLKPFRYARMKRQTVVLKVPRTFLDRTLWPQFAELDTALTSYLDDITDKVIREEVHGETRDAEEVAEPKAIAS